MIKSLQKKFVAVSMGGVTLLLLFLLGGINIINIISYKEQNEMVLDYLARNMQFTLFGGLDSGVITFTPEKNSPADSEKNFLRQPVGENTRNENIYFTARITSGLSFSYLDISKVATLSEEEAREIVIKAYNEQKQSGKVGSYLYSSRQYVDGSTLYVFLDTTNGKYDIYRVAFVSFVLGALCWLAMLLVIMLLSKKAISPIARNLEQQKQFITDAGHEIKTPLAIILANTEALELHTAESKWSKNIKNQVERLTGLTQNLLTIAKLDETKAKLETEPLNISQIVFETAEMFREPASLKHISFQPILEDNVIIKGNKDHISRIVSILLDNAVKYTDENGFIRYEVHRKERNCEMVFRNSCNNLPEENLDRLFDRFYRGDRARTQKSGGYGIGLSAAKAITELYGGKITVSLENENEIVFRIKI